MSITLCVFIFCTNKFNCQNFYSTVLKKIQLTYNLRIQPNEYDMRINWTYNVIIARDNKNMCTSTNIYLLQILRLALKAQLKKSNFLAVGWQQQKKKYSTFLGVHNVAH